uniref:Putative secreted protein n=1 Tax=Anopheles darlingi TaxID=43151 RepID=A0A2M4D9E3_ANODA
MSWLIWPSLAWQSIQPATPTCDPVRPTTPRPSVWRYRRADRTMRSRSCSDRFAPTAGSPSAAVYWH